MKVSKVWLWTCLASAWGAGCDDPPDAEMPRALGALDAGSALPLDAATATATQSDAALGEADPAQPPRVGPAYAVVSSDFTATSISILDSQGQVLADDYIHSGSTRAGLVTALSGDVELPTRSGESGTLVLLDRFRSDVVTRVRLADGAILGQVKTHTPQEQASTRSFSSNPKDYVYVDEQTAWITRGEPNLDPSAPEVDRGDDLFRINPTTMQRTGELIDLSTLDLKVQPPGEHAEVQVYARPTRMVRLGKTVVVGISRTSFDFSVMGPGAVALVNLEHKTVSAVELEGLKNCSGIHDVPNDSDSVLVACAGGYGDPRETAGLVHLGVADGKATVEHIYRAKDDPSARPLTSSAVALGGTLVAAAANDHTGTNPDVFAVVDLATGKRTELVSVAPGSSRFGTPAYDSTTGLLLLPDSSVDANKEATGGVRRFLRNADGTFSELAITRVATRTGMPARHVYPL